jgi:predicted DNA binding CopG/RHH family protein
MQSTVPPASTTPSSFVGFLAALAQPEPTSAWNDELLGEDVATLSYERALRTHARYHADDSADDLEEAKSVVSADAAAPQPVAPFSAPSILESAPEKNLKEASITIRMSREENVQLRKRAGEAGLTVSAYIRSCTFEAEALRALVKDTLTQFRAGGPPAQQHTKTPNPRRRWSALFWPGRRTAHDTAQSQA